MEKICKSTNFLKEKNTSPRQQRMMMLKSCDGDEGIKIKLLYSNEGITGMFCLFTNCHGHQNLFKLNHLSSRFIFIHTFIPLSQDVGGKENEKYLADEF